MGLIKEPLAVDFVVDSRPLTEKEENSISDYIRADKERRERASGTNPSSSKEKQNARSIRPDR